MSDFGERPEVVEIPSPGRTGFVVIGAVFVVLALVALAAPFVTELSRDFQDLAWMGGAVLFVGRGRRRHAPVGGHPAPGA